VRTAHHRAVAEGARIGRRAWVKLGVVGGAVLAAGGGVAAWLSWGYEGKLGAHDHPIALSAKELAVVRALVEALLPGGGGLPRGVELGVQQRVDEEVWASEPRIATQIKQALQLLEHLPLAYGRASRFTSLVPTEREAVFTELLRSERDTVRAVALTFREMLHLFYYGDERTWEAMRYDGPLGIAAKPPVSHVVYARLLRRRPGSAA